VLSEKLEGLSGTSGSKKKNPRAYENHKSINRNERTNSIKNLNKLGEAGSSKHFQKLNFYSPILEVADHSPYSFQDICEGRRHSGANKIPGKSRLQPSRGFNEMQAAKQGPQGRKSQFKVDFK
jgi:hypothetical protein